MRLYGEGEWLRCVYVLLKEVLTGSEGFSFAVYEVRHEMGLHIVFGIDFVFVERNPVVDTKLRLDVIAEECPNKAIRLELAVCFPSIIRAKELVSVILPCGFNGVSYCKIDATRHEIILINVQSSGVFDLFFGVYDIDIIDMLEIVAINTLQET